MHSRDHTAVPTTRTSFSNYAYFATCCVENNQSLPMVAKSASRTGYRLDVAIY